MARLSDQQLLDLIVPQIQLGSTPTSVNDQITDAVTQTLRAVVGSADIMGELVQRRRELLVPDPMSRGKGPNRGNP